MACRRSVELDDAFQERPGFVEKPAVRFSLSLPECFACQPKLGLSELEQCSRIGVYRVSGALEVSVREAGVSRTAGEDSGVDGVMTEQHGMIFPEQQTRPALVTGLHQDVDQRIRDK